MTVKDTIASCLIIALGTILALHFALFWLYGGVFIHETNKVILTIETAMSAAIIGFGIERFVTSAISIRPHHASSHRAANRQYKYTARTAPSPTWVADTQATVPAYAAATAVTATASPLLGSDRADEINHTHVTSESTECTSPILVHLTQPEREPTVDTSAASFPTPH